MDMSEWALDYFWKPLLVNNAPCHLLMLIKALSCLLVGKGIHLLWAEEEKRLQQYGGCRSANSIPVLQRVVNAEVLEAQPPSCSLYITAWQSVGMLYQHLQQAK